MLLRLVVVSVGLATMSAGLAACELLFPTVAGDTAASAGDDGGDATTAGDAGAESAAIADAGSDGSKAAKDFSIAVSPGTQVLAAGQSASIRVDAQRVAGFTDAINVSFSAPSYVTGTSPVVIPVGATNATFTLTAQPAIPAANVGDWPMVVTGETAAGETATTTLVVHLSGLLAVFTGGKTSLPIPGNVSLIRVKAWGAGGGNGCNGGVNGGGPGGAGGYVMADVVVTPGETLGIEVGAGGIGTAQCKGGGGGRTAVLRGATILVVAGGGGGGGTGCSAIGGGGGGGGGPAGLDGPMGACGAAGGGGATQTADGTNQPPGSGAGAGGGGLHDGGSGGTVGNTCGCPGAGGGGGGSGGSGALDAGVSVGANLAAGAGSGAPPNTGDPDYGPDAGAGAGPNFASSQQPGNDGRIVILVP